MKSIFIIIFLMTFTFKINSQIISNYGLKLGVGISNQSWDYQLYFDNKIGISPRIFAEFFNLPFFQLQAELGFLQKGFLGLFQKGFNEKIRVTSMTQHDGTGEFINVNNRLNYLSFSALAKFKYENLLFSPYIIVGPQLNILLSKEIEKGLEVVFNNFRENNIDLSIGAGTEIENVLPILILVEYRYERDFINNYDTPSISIKNYSHVILIGLKI